MAPPTTFGVVSEREIYVVKEATPGVIPGTIGVPVPVTTFKPSDKPLWLNDESWQGNMGDIYGVYQGPLIASLDVGGHITGDTFGHFLYNLLGDYTTTGTTAAPAGTTSAPLAVGATTINVASGGASFTNGMFLWLQDAGTPAANEVVTVNGSSTSTTIPITPTRFAHLTAMPFTNTTAPYTHVFSLLNGSIGAANGPAQPPTHCITERNGLAANGANQYAYCCASELVITGNAEKLLDWTGKFTCAARATAASPVGFANVSAVNPYPSWRTVTGIAGPASGGTQVKNIVEHAITMQRAVKAFNTEQGSQQPYIIARGKQMNQGKLLFAPSIDDTALTNMLGNTQPQTQFVSSNGLAGVNLVSVQIDIIQSAYTIADENDQAELFGYDVSFTPVHTATTSGGVSTTGASGGKGAVKVTLVNAIPSY